MKSRKFVYGAVIFTAVFVAALLLAGEGKGMNYRGWLVDQACAFSPKGVAFDGTDTKVNPELHSLKCALMPPCVASGYGIYMKEDDGNYEYYKFDKKGSKLVEDLLRKTSKENYIEVEVNASLKGDILRVSSLKEL